MSSVPQEWGRDPWFMGRKEAFREYAASPALPRWLRVTNAAYSQVGGNGHAVFRQLELAEILGEVVDGVWQPTKRQRVREAIDGAIERGLLLEGSKALCLVVPRNAIAFGAGDPSTPCKRHPRAKRNAKTVSPGFETTRFQPVLSPLKERGNRVVSRSGPLSLLEPHSGPSARPAS